MVARFDQKNINNFQKEIKQALKKVSDLRPAFDEIVRSLYKSNKSIFSLQGAGAYPDFKNDRSKNQKLRKVRFAYPLLKRSGRLETSITIRRSEDAREKIEKTKFQLETVVPYSGFLQAGTRFMKARPFFFLGPESSKQAELDSNLMGGRFTRAVETIRGYVEEVAEELE